MGGLSQSATAKYLRKAQTDAEVDEILGAYVHSKQSRATHPAQVQRKLTLLQYYMTAMGQHEQTARHAASFRTASSLASSSIPASHFVTPMSPLGIEAWQDATKQSKGWFTSSSSRGTSSSSSSLSNFSF